MTATVKMSNCGAAVSRQISCCSQFLVIVKDALHIKESKQQLKVMLAWVSVGRHRPRQPVLLMKDQI